MIATLMLMLAAQADCRNPQAQQDMNRCAALDYQRADAALNAQWRLTQTAMQEMDRNSGPVTDGRPTHAAQLLTAQRAWIAYRDAHCTSVGFEMRGGSAEPLLVAGCKTRLTRERTQQLKELAGG